jgi:uncharacterized UBP type Zn finger protein
MKDTSIDISAPCEHVDEVKVRSVERPAEGCVVCLQTGGVWVHLRECLTCGLVHCCDSSPGKHATKHFHATRHPIVSSAEVGENWAFCYVDDAMLSA